MPPNVQEPRRVFDIREVVPQRVGRQSHGSRKRFITVVFKQRYHFQNGRYLFTLHIQIAIDEILAIIDGRRFHFRRLFPTNAERDQSHTGGGVEFPFE